MIRDLINYIKLSIDELKKVTWPTKAETARYSIIVIVSTIISVGLLTVIDYGLNSIVDYLVS
jgi:preprotein translocase subunit SecE